jgi:glyoxylase-like metal-dependent hydrolase (beta-lactamase superfamily II)
VREEDALLTGDHVMGWSTTVISPPDGDMGDYMRSLELLLSREDRLLIPTHGPTVDDPKPFVRALIAHRQEREQQIVRCLEQGVTVISEMVPRMYQGTPKILYPAAARSVFAHMLHMLERGAVTCDGPPAIDARYRLV